MCKLDFTIQPGHPPQEMTEQDGCISTTDVYYHMTNEIINTSTL